MYPIHLFILVSILQVINSITISSNVLIINIIMHLLGNQLIIHGLSHQNGLRFYFPISQVKIPFDDEASTEEIDEFVHSLMILRVFFLILPILNF